MIAVAALCTGRPSTLPGGKRSAIAKQPVTGPVAIGALGLAGDTQVDRRHHGGPEMAVHLYPLDHHAFWRARLGDTPLLHEPGAFGGNIAVSGLDETGVRLGEHFRLGSALLEISQPRMPCATIERRFQHTGMVETILATGRCGWYFRVLASGTAQAGDALEAVAGTGSPHTIRAVFAAIADPASLPDPAMLRELADDPALSADWREKAERRLRRTST